MHTHSREIFFEAAVLRIEMSTDQYVSLIQVLTVLSTDAVLMSSWWLNPMEMKVLLCGQ